MTKGNDSIENTAPSCGSAAVTRDPEVLKKRILSQDPEILAAVQKISRAVANLPADSRTPGSSPRALLVGGFVRDSAFGLKPKDADVQVYGVAPADLELLLECLFPGSIKKVGKSYEIIKVKLNEGHDIDVSIPRKGSAVTQENFEQADPSVPVKEAALQRDFSMNNLAADPCTGEVFDFCGGLDDLKAGHLRVSSEEVFRSRGIHVYRAAQFASRMRLKPDAEAFRIMSEMVRDGITEDIHPARLTEEFNKLLVKGCQPSRGLELLRRFGVISKHFPELNGLIESNKSLRNTKSDWVKTLMIVDHSAKILFQREEVQDPQESFVAMLGALCCYLLKVKDDRPDFSLAKSFLDRLFLSAELKAAVLSMIIHFKKIDEFYWNNFKDQARAEQSRSPVKKMAPLMPIRSPGVVNSQRRFTEAQRIIDMLYPAKYSAALCLSEAIYRLEEPVETYKAGIFFDKLVRSEGLARKRRRPLLQKNEIMKAFDLKAGLHIGYLIGEVEKLRFKLITKERALLYLSEHREELMARAVASVNSGEAS